MLLDCLLEIEVVLVGNVKGQFQLGDLDLELLLDSLDLGLQFRFGFNNTSIQLFDLDARLLAVIKKLQEK